MLVLKGRYCMAYYKKYISSFLSPNLNAYQYTNLINVKYILVKIFLSYEYLLTGVRNKPGFLQQA